MMNEPVATSSAKRPTLGTWIPCVGSTLLLFGLASFLRMIAPAARKAFANEVSNQWMESWENILDLAELLWIPLLLCVGWGFRLFWKGSRSGVLIWFLWTTIFFGTLHAALIGRIYAKLVFEAYEYHTPY